MGEELVLSSQVAISREIDGLEMGVLQDGTSYLTGRGLAKLCGVAPSTIIHQATTWLSGERRNKLAQMLVAQGLERPSLFIEVSAGSKISHAYPDDVCMVVLEYYAFESTPAISQAQANFRKLARAGLRVFVYHALGYDPAKVVPAEWRQFHDRLALHTLPSAHFSVFREAADFVLAAIRGGLKVDHQSIPDISIGIIWSKHWEENGFDERFGNRIKHPHNYPDYFPQAASNPQAMWVYPIDGLPEFRRWVENEYIPKKFPAYLKGRVAKGILAASVAELLLTEVSPVPALGV